MTWLTVVFLISGFTMDKADIFASKMSYYYEQDLKYEMYYFHQGWWGATVWELGGCTDTVYLSDQFLGELGDDELWKGVLAHEWGHVFQGVDCKNNEKNADKKALKMLLDAKEFLAYLRWATYLREVKGWSIEDIYINTSLRSVANLPAS